MRIAFGHNPIHSKRENNTKEKIILPTRNTIKYFVCFFCLKKVAEKI